MEKQWVFEKLVKDEKDAVGLIAYSLYKFEKSARAKTLRAQGASEQDIQSRLQTFHDDALETRLTPLREQGKSYLTDLSEAIEEGLIADYGERQRKLEADYETKRAILEKECKDKIKKERACVINAARSAATKERTWGEAFKEEAVGHTLKALGQIIAGVIILGLVASLVPSDMKAAIVLKALENVGFSIPAATPPTVKP